MLWEGGEVSGDAGRLVMEVATAIQVMQAGWRWRCRWRVGWMQTGWWWGC